MRLGLRHAAPLIALAALAGCGGKPPSTPTRDASPPPLATQVVHAETGPDQQVWDGVVEAVNRVTITAQTNARVLELPYDVNDIVPKGAVLVRFTDVEQKSARSAAQAQIASARATYDESVSSYQRFAELYPKGYVSKAELDQQRARRDAAGAALRSAQAQLAQVGQQFDYTVLRAPYAGIITRRFVHVGEAVQAGPPSPQPLIALESLADLRVTVQVPQSAVDAIRKVHAAEILPEGLDGRRVPADQINVFPYADPNTHTFGVRTHVAGSDTGLYPGMSVKVAFPTGESRQLLVPRSALVHRGEIIGVYVVGEHGVALRQLRVGATRGNRVEVLAGLADGEKIATDPVAALKYLDQRHATGAPADE